MRKRDTKWISVKCDNCGIYTYFMVNMPKWMHRICAECGEVLESKEMVTEMKTERDYNGVPESAFKELCEYEESLYKEFLQDTDNRSVREMLTAATRLILVCNNAPSSLFYL